MSPSQNGVSVSRQFLICFFLIAVLPNSAFANSLSDGVTIKKWQDFKATVGVGLNADADCPVVNKVLYEKINARAYGGQTLTSEEFEGLVGSKYDFFGIFGGSKFYNRHTGGVEDTLSVYARLNGLDIDDQTIYSSPEKMKKLREVMSSFSPDALPDDMPILCGDGSIEKQYKENQRQLMAKKEAEKREYERTCEACTLRGGPLLQAIYDGDYDRQYDIALTYMLRARRAGGSDAAAYGTLFTALSNVGDITLLEDLIGSYMLYSSSKWDDDCYEPGAKKIKFTREFSDIVIETYSGVQLERFEGGSVTTEYKINPDFKQACDKLCNKHGSILLTATAISGFSPNKVSAERVFWGLGEFVDKYQCRSPEIAQFEANLLDMWEQEKAQPAGTRRNSASEHFR